MENKNSSIANRMRAVLALPFRIARSILVELIEAVLRIKHLSNPKTYSAGLRVGKIHDGARVAKGGVHVVFVLRAKRAVPTFIMRGVKAFADAGANVTVVLNNRPANLSVVEALKANAWRVIERANVGRDFGAYKDAIANLRVLEARQSIILDKLILANDSVYYFETGLADMARQFVNDDADFLGTTETIQYHSHVQSFLLGFSKRVLENKRFRRYWRRYLPVSTRRWSIHAGEVGLTRKLMRAGFAPKVIYSADRLKHYLETLSKDALWEASQKMPLHFRRSRAAQLNEIWSAPIEQTGGRLEVLFRRFANLQIATANAGPVNGGGVEVLDKYLQLVSNAIDHANVTSRYASERLRTEMIDYVISSNQMHMGGLLMVEGLKMPILKRDLVFREVFQAYEVVTSLENGGIADTDEIAADLRAKGVPIYFKGLKRFLYDVGII